MTAPLSRLLARQGNLNNYQDYKGPGVGLWWLGQAGFLIRFKDVTLLIDPYLSDSLADKYRGNKYPHRRMMAAPINPSCLLNIDYYICTHSHSDHMDPGSIPVIRDLNPGCQYILPEAVQATGFDRGIPADKMILMDDERSVVLQNDITIHGIAAAHEGLDRDSKGRHLFLGYILQFGKLAVYHSGDCVSYPGLCEKLEPFNINLALLPVNGRKESLSLDGIVGNFFFDEALRLVMNMDIDFMIPHHYGMFNFNTVDVNKLKKTIIEQNLETRVYPAQLDILFQLEGTDG